NQWFEGPGTKVSISDDGKWALFSQYGHAMAVYSLETGQQNPDYLLGGLTSVESAVFCGPGSMARLGRRASEQGIFLPGTDGPQLSSFPANAIVTCSADGGEIAYYIPENPDRQIFVGPMRGPFRTFGLSGRITATAFSPDGNMLYVLLFGES